MTRTAVQALLMSAAFAMATVAVGWLAVPGVALLWGVARQRHDRPALVAMLAAGLGWVWLMVWNAAVGEVSDLAAKTGDVFGLTGIGFVALTLAFPMVMAWGAAVVGGSVRGKSEEGGGRSGGLQKEASDSSPRRPMLTGEIEIGGRTWSVKEEIRQGPRPQIFILTTADVATSQMHIRPMPGVELTTIEEVASTSSHPLTRTFADGDGVLWEARMVVSSGDSGDTELIKIYSYQKTEAYEEPYTFKDGLGLRTDDELRELLEKTRGEGRGQ